MSQVGAGRNKGIFSALVQVETALGLGRSCTRAWWVGAGRNGTTFGALVQVGMPLGLGRNSTKFGVLVQTGTALGLVCWCRQEWH